MQHSPIGLGRQTTSLTTVGFNLMITGFLTLFVSVTAQVLLIRHPYLGLTVYGIAAGWILALGGLAIISLGTRSAKSAISRQVCSVCGHGIGESSFFYSNLQNPTPFFHEHCYREIFRGQRRKCLNCNVPLYNPRSREFVVPVVLGDKRQLFCSTKCSETYKPLEEIAVALPIEVTCSYCKSVFSSSLTKCPNCGAIRSRPSFDLLKLSPSDFEQKVAELLLRMGYSNVTRVGGSGDRAVDITAQRKDEFGRIRKHAVQCKRYDPSSRVGSTEMQVFCSMISRVHGSDRGIFVTTSSFTNEAVEIAGKFGVTLVDRELLEELLVQYA